MGSKGVLSASGVTSRSPAPGFTLGLDALMFCDSPPSSAGAFLLSGNGIAAQQCDQPFPLLGPKRRCAGDDLGDVSGEFRGGEVLAGGLHDLGVEHVAAAVKPCQTGACARDFRGDGHDGVDPSQSFLRGHPWLRPETGRAGGAVPLAERIAPRADGVSVCRGRVPRPLVLTRRSALVRVNFTRPVPVALRHSG